MLPTRKKKSPGKRSRPVQTTPQEPTLRPHAAGIDVGATELYVAVPIDADPQPVRVFGTFTEDLLALADWLQQCQVRTVALESTGTYWICLFQVLEARGLEVCLVNARHVKNVPGRKTDVSDCQWLQQLHAMGLLQASFRPPAQVCAVRSLLRHRDGQVRAAARATQHMQKALTQMNLQLAHVLSDITGKTGLAIIDAILAGERDPQRLATLRDRRVKASVETVAKSLTGDWQPEHLFTLRQARRTYAHYQEMIAEVDAELSRRWQGFAAAPAEATTGPAPAQPTPKATVEKATELRLEFHRILGVDLTLVPGLQTTTISVFLSEVGPSLARFATAKRFASWLGLCPDNRITGGIVQSSATRQVKSRTAHALRLSAQSLQRSQSSLGDYFRRMKARLGAPAAITATAHKLARIIHHLVTNRCAYQASVFAQEEEYHRSRRERSLQRQAQALGFELMRTPALPT